MSLGLRLGYISTGDFPLARVLGLGLALRVAADGDRDIATGLCMPIDDPSVG